MRLLFIKLKHIGDALLLTPTIAAARTAYPDACIWVVVRKGCEGILEGCPMIDRVLTSAAPEKSKRNLTSFVEDVRLVRSLREQKFDYAFELSDNDRGRWLCALSGAKNCGTSAFKTGLGWWWKLRFDKLSQFDWTYRHQVEKNFFTVHQILPLGTETPPPLVFHPSCVQEWKPGEGLENFVLFHPGTRWARKRWPTDRWIDLGRRLMAHVPRIVISCGPDPQEVESAKKIQEAIGPQALNTEGRLNWRQLAGLFYKARLFVGVDTAAMHLAAACQTPSVALFGPSVAREWRPWGSKHQLVQPAFSVPGLPSDSEARELMQRISVDEVLVACEKMLAEKR